MTYVVQNQANFQAAYAGALAGFGFGGKYILSNEPEAFEQFNQAAANAFAYASALDTLMGSSTEEFQSSMIFACSIATFTNRSTNPNLDSDDFIRLANSVFAIFEAGIVYADSQDVEPTSGNQSVVKQIQTDAAGFGTITEGDPATTICTVNITTEGNSQLLIQGFVTGNGQVHDGSVSVIIKVDGSQEQNAIASWVVADDVARSIPIAIPITGLLAGDHVITMTIVISAGAAGTQFADASTKNTLSVIEYVNP